MSNANYLSMGITATDMARQKVEWAAEILEAELKESAYAEAAYDLYRLYSEEVSVWSLLKERISERLMTPQQALVLDILFKVSQAGSVEQLTESFKKELPAYLTFSVKW